MNTSALPLRPAAADSLLAGVPLALLAHALLLVALAIGVNWRSSDDPGVAEAELWALVPQAAAPPAPPPEPEPVAQPKPAPAPEPDRAAEQRAAEQQREAEIALERERERRQQRQREEEAERKAKAEQDKKDKLKKDKAEQQRRDAEAKKKADEQRKKTEAADAAKASKADEARREKQRQENLRRMQGLAGGNGAADSTGTAAKSAGPSAGYGGRIKARVKPNITLTEAPAGNPLAEVEVKTAPDGLILARRLLRPSGDAAWDAAVLRAIDKTERLPRDEDGRVPPVLIISFRPND